MSIEPTPNGKHRVRWREPGKANPRSRTFATEAEAKRFERSVLTDIDRGTYTAPRRSTDTIEATATAWLAASRRLATTTRETYRRDLDRHILPALGTTRLANLTPEAIDAYLDARLAAGAAPSSVRRERATLSRLCSWAVGRGRLITNPVTRTEAPPSARTTHRYLTADELEAIADALAPAKRGRRSVEGRYRALVLVAGWGGLRWSELVGLRPDDIEGDVIHVRSQLQRSQATGEWARTGPKTKAGNRRVPLPASVAAELADHIDRFAADGPHGPLVFPTRAATPIDSSMWWNHHWRPALARAGTAAPLPRPHDLRHTAVTLAIAAGAHPKTIQARMGHASIQVTLDVYGHLFPDLEDSVARALDRLRDTMRPAPGR